MNILLIADKFLTSLELQYLVCMDKVVTKLDSKTYHILNESVARRLCITPAFHSLISLNPMFV
uniref:Uncharacterized protein n=1 Tax=Anguilla anguilla TaxID=7936 RepID=A0A0E9QE48_ANGAN